LHPKAPSQAELTKPASIPALDTLPQKAVSGNQLDKPKSNLDLKVASKAASKAASHVSLAKPKSQTHLLADDKQPSKHSLNAEVKKSNISIKKSTASIKVDGGETTTDAPAEQTN